MSGLSPSPSPAQAIDQRTTNRHRDCGYVDTVVIATHATFCVGFVDATFVLSPHVRKSLLPLGLSVRTSHQ